MIFGVSRVGLNAEQNRWQSCFPRADCSTNRQNGNQKDELSAGPASALTGCGSGTRGDAEEEAME
jgi:hypothetical protein